MKNIINFGKWKKEEATKLVYVVARKDKNKLFIRSCITRSKIASPQYEFVYRKKGKK